MDESKVKTLTRQIMALPEAERQQLAREILPLILTTRAGLEGIDQALQALSKSWTPWLNGLGPEGTSQKRALPP